MKKILFLIQRFLKIFFSFKPNTRFFSIIFQINPKLWILSSEIRWNCQWTDNCTDNRRHQGWSYRRFVIGSVRYGPMVRNWYLIRLFGSVGGSNTWYEVIWFGTWYENLVRSYLVRSEIGDFSVPIWYDPLIWFDTDFFRQYIFDLKNIFIIKKQFPIGNPDRTDFGPTYSVRYWFAPKFSRKRFLNSKPENFDKIINDRTGPTSDQLIWFVIGSVRGFSAILTDTKKWRYRLELVGIWMMFGKGSFNSTLVLERINYFERISRFILMRNLQFLLTPMQKVWS